MVNSKNSRPFCMLALDLELTMPLLLGSAPTVVNVSVLLLTLSSPDESSVTYEIGFLMVQKWEDLRVRFDDGGRHKYLNALMHADKIWMPDTYFIKHGEFKYPEAHFDPIHLALKIFPNGTVLYTTR